MNLAEALSCLPAERLREIAAFYGLAGGPSLSSSRGQYRRSSGPDGGHAEPGARDDLSELAARISRHLLVPANLIVAIRGLDTEELTAARLICLSRDGAGVVMEQCHQKLNQISRKWRRNGARVIEGLSGRGLVFTEKQGYRQAYYVPDDLRSVLSRWFLEGIYSRCIQQDPPGRRFSDLTACLRHLFLFLSYVRKNNCKLTQSGMLFKRAQQELESIMGQSEGTDDLPFPVRYPPRLAFIVFFAKSRALVEEQDGALILGRKAEDWRKQDIRTLRKDLFDYWMQTFMARDVDLTTLFWIMMRSPHGTWLSLDNLIAEMEDLALTHVPSAFSIRAEKNLVNDLEYLGALEVSRSFGTIAVRVTPLGRAMAGLGPWPDETYEERVYVEPNFDVMVPSGIHPGVLWEIDSIADLVKADQMMIFRLTRSSVYRAVRDGLGAGRIIRFLEEHSGSPLPQNVAYSIAQWAGAYGRVQLIDTLLIKCDSPHLAEELALSRKLAPYILERVGPFCFRVERSARNEVSKILMDEGYMPKLDEDMRLSPEGIVGGKHQLSGEGQEATPLPGLPVYEDDGTEGSHKPENGKDSRR